MGGEKITVACVCTDIDLVNKGGTPYEVTVTPEQCCLQITHNDTDCEVINILH